MLTIGLESEFLDLYITRINNVNYGYREFDPLSFRTLIIPILSSLLLVLQPSTSG